MSWEIKLDKLKSILLKSMKLILITNIRTLKEIWL